MAIFTDSRGRRYQNDRFREPKVGEVFLDASHSFYGKFVRIQDDNPYVEWSHVDTPETTYSTGEYALKHMEREKIYLEVAKPLIIIC